MTEPGCVKSASTCVSQDESIDPVEAKTAPPPLLDAGTAHWVIAIDGPAGAGKSTAAKMLAQRLGFFLLDSGALYRVVALHLLRAGIDALGGPVPAWALTAIDIRVEPSVASMGIFLGGEDVTAMIREERIGLAASRFSARREVRSLLLQLQRSLADEFDLVAEGRDMGTVVFPHAALKFFLTADLWERSQRRFKELDGRGETAELERVCSEMRDRDLRDETREEAPLAKAPDAVEIDTTHLSPEEVIDRMMEQVAARQSSPPRRGRRS